MFCATGWKSEISRRRGAKGVSLPASKLVPFQNCVGLRGWTRTGRPYPTFRGMRKSSTCGFDFTDCGMLGGFRPGPVNRHSFWNRRAGGSAIAPNNGPGTGGEAVGRMAARAAEAKNCGVAASLLSGALGTSRVPPTAARGARPAGGGRASWPPLSSPSCILAPAAESFSKIVLASPSEFPYSTSSHGGVAQLGERLTGSQEVRGSIPLVSTRALNEAPTQVGAFFHIGTQGQRRHHDPPGRQDRKKLRRARPL